MFKATISFNGSNQDAIRPLTSIEDAIDPRIIIESEDFPRGQHIEIKLSEDGAIIIEAWDENEEDFINSRIITFDEVVGENSTDDGEEAYEIEHSQHVVTIKDDAPASDISTILSDKLGRAVSVSEVVDDSGERLVLYLDQDDEHFGGVICLYPVR